MLKRYQVLLPDWLEEYIKFLVEKYDLSFSEVIRTELCVNLLGIVPTMYPEYKPEITHKEITDLMKSEAQENMERSDVHKILSKIYFEARKAIEYRLDKERQKKKK